MKPSLAIAALEFLVKQNAPAMLWGAPGVGKSDLVRQVAKKLGLELIDIRLSQFDPTDLKGFPVVTGKGANAVAHWVPPALLPTEGKGILFLDELPSAPQAVQASAYQLVLDRKLGEYTLPEGWTVVAAGNRSEDRSVVHTQPAALANRFTHLEIEVDVEDWLGWAAGNGIHDVIRGFIRFRPAALTTLKLDAGVKGFASPRSWSFANKFIRRGLDAQIERNLLVGTVGAGPSQEFIVFMREASNMPDIEDIFKDPTNAKVPENISTQHAVVAALEARATADNYDVLMQYVARLPLEFQVVFVQSTVKRDDSVCETSSYTAWTTKHQELLLNA